MSYEKCLAARTEEDRRLVFESVLDLAIDRLAEAVEHVTADDILLLSKLAGVLSDLAVIAGYKKDDLDREEQRAKIDKLHAQAQHEEPPQGGGVLVLPGVGDSQEAAEEDDRFDRWLEAIRQP